MQINKILTFLGLSAGLGLAGCTDQQLLITKQLIVVEPTAAQYYCPVLKSFPRWKTLTDSQVSDLLITLYKNNVTCKSSIESIRRLIENEKTYLNDSKAPARR